MSCRAFKPRSLPGRPGEDRSRADRDHRAVPVGRCHPEDLRAQFSRSATEALGFPSYQTALIGWVLLACTIVFAVARTAVLGAVALTAYLGGAVTIDMHEEAWFPVIFAVGFGLLIWAALVLRRRELLKVLIGA